MSTAPPEPARSPDAGPAPVEAGPVLAALGAVLILVSLFLPWFDPGGSAWTVFEFIDLALAAVALAALVAAVERVGVRELPQVPVPLSAAGVVVFVLVGSQLVNHPPAAIGSSVDTGGWLALGGAALMLVGGLLSRARIRFVLRPPADSAAPERPAAPGAGRRDEATRRL
ncbi:MAG TPA: hypothetical protein VE570_16100 [Thermoleophilaceae bacterium]|jgi:hypothetical protein|nr:hypothetical protein [Thermoleophilaceae bacterium]